MNYDDWKLSTPDEVPEFECEHCGKPIENVGYCSNDCFEADQL